MQYTPELVQELNILTSYNLTTTQTGIKIHKSAAADTINAIKRLYEKNLITQSDGGYLTDLGREVAEHAQAALTILRSRHSS